MNDLVRELKARGVFGHGWGTGPALAPGCVEPSRVLDSGRVEATLRSGLLRHPYFRLLRDGEEADPGTYTRRRSVIGKAHDGFPDLPALLAHRARGCLLVLDQLSHWHPAVGALMRALDGCPVPVAVSSRAYLAPPAGCPLPPRDEGAHRITVQLEGTARLTRGPGPLVAAGGPEDRESALAAGDALYTPHTSTGPTGELGPGALQLVLTLREAEHTDYVRALTSHYLASHRDFAGNFHSLALPDRAAAVRRGLLAAAQELDADVWRAMTVRLIQSEAE